jgi:hypothetical protein
MAEYAGYVPNQAPANFGGIASGIASDIISIKEQARKEEMELAQMGYKRQKEQEKQFAEDLSKFGKVEKTIGQSYNQFATKSIRTISDAFGNVTRRHYKGDLSATDLAIIKNNLMGLQDGLAAAAKNFNEGAKLIEKDSQKQSKIGSVMNQMYANAGDFTNKQLVVDDQGNGVLVSIGPDGKVLGEQSPIDPSAIPSPTQFQDYNVDYDKDLNEWMKSIGNYDVETGMVTIKTPKNNPEFERAKKAKIQQLTGSARDAARFLTQVGDYNAYNTEEQKKQLLEQGYTEDKLIKIGVGKGGFPEPILTDSQKSKAVELADKQINQRISYERRLDEPKSIKISTGEGKTTEAKSQRKGFLATANDIYNQIEQGGRASAGAAELARISQRLGLGNVKVKNAVNRDGVPLPGVIQISGVDEYGDKVEEFIRNPKDVFRLLYPKDKRGQAIVDYDIAMEEAGGGKSSLGSYSYKNAKFDLDKIAADHGLKTKEQVIKFIKNNF